MNSRIEEAEGYYTLPRITEPFEGQVIKLSARETNLLFQTYTVNGCPNTFTETLCRMEKWFIDKQYKLYKDGKWMRHVAKWLHDDRERSITKPLEAKDSYHTPKGFAYVIDKAHRDKIKLWSKVIIDDEDLIIIGIQDYVRQDAEHERGDFAVITKEI